MNPDFNTSQDHASVWLAIDKSLAGDASTAEETIIREHLQSCSECREYLALSQRAIASLKGFSFGRGPETREVVAALMVRAQKSEATEDHRLQIWAGCLTAIALTVAGSFTASQVLRLLALILPLNATRIHFSLLAFWVVPSVCVCLLFLLLPMLSGGWLHKKGLSL